MLLKISKKAISKTVAIALIIIILVAVIGGAYWYYQAISKPKKEELIIGGTLPLTGLAAPDGQRIYRATKLAVDKINEEGGIMGMKVRLIVYDDGFSLEKIASLYEKLITTDKADILITPYGAPSAFPALTVAKKYDKIMIAGFVASTSPSKQFGGRWGFFPHCMPAPVYSSYYYSLFTDMLGEFEKWNYKPGFSFKKRVAVLNEKQLWGMEQHEIWRPLAEKQGWEIVMDEFVDLEATDFSSIIAKIKMEKPDLILCEFFYFRCVMMLKQMIEQNVTASFVVMPETATSYDWIDPSKGVGPIGNGILALSYFPPDYHGGGADYLRTKYKELYGIEPSAHEVMGFSAIEIIKQAIEKARSLDSEAIRKVLLSETFETCFTKVKFDKEGCNELYRPAVAQWINNKLEVVWPTDRATAKPLYPWPPK